MEHLRMSGAYWGLTTLDLVGKLGAVDRDEIVSWVMQCQHESGGFAGNIGHDPTCSTRLVLCKFWFSLTSSMFWTSTSYRTTSPDCKMKMDHLQETFGVKLILGAGDIWGEIWFGPF
ncbi:uncharacterized protein LOC113353741 [Papaver somniferum]|uniref:uncharacterized protein LOC113353741 n=1 Tax=Papaver somniferum TaxID=3469 RepID=UPI000E6FE644|nr:uncharacterized protein LOC113353741 [Papaver somniferum]